VLERRQRERWAVLAQYALSRDDDQARDEPREERVMQPELVVGVAQAIARKGRAH
jgi:hypothetical protein